MTFGIVLDIIGIILVPVLLSLLIVSAIWDGRKKKNPESGKLGDR